jgi:rubrerythrin
MGKPEKVDSFTRDREYVKYHQLLRRAGAEGRLGGKYTCKLCGMAFHTQQQADECCKIRIG